LLSSSAGGTAFQYNYDPFGRQESVSSGGAVVERSVYDGFDHVVEAQKRGAGGVMETTSFTFDPLDRTATKTAGGKTTTFNYLGMSNEILGEEVAGQLTKSYQYSPWGERLSQVKHNTDGTAEDSYYGYNGHTDVETLTDGNGDTRATYGYTAYGSNDDAEFTGIDKPDAGDPTKEVYNPYRFNAKRWDAQSGTYDMGFRDYNPGLNRFTTRDMYNGALADMSLGSDPFSGNRYAFTGGNPISNVEIDGHVIAALLPFLPAMVEGLAYAAAYVGAALLLTAATVDTVNAASGAWDDAEEGEETAPAPKPTPRSPADDGRSRAAAEADG
jgi:RHS repeat-associated protein